MPLYKLKVDNYSFTKAYQKGFSWFFTLHQLGK